MPTEASIFLTKSGLILRKYPFNDKMCKRNGLAGNGDNLIDVNLGLSRVYGIGT